MITHQNLAHQFFLSRELLGASQASVGVVWVRTSLPLCWRSSLTPSLGTSRARLWYDWLHSERVCQRSDTALHFAFDLPSSPKSVVRFDDALQSDDDLLPKLRLRFSATQDDA